MAVKVREWKGAWWVFVDFRGRRKAKRVGVGKPGKRAAEAVVEKIQAQLALGTLSVFESTRERALTLADHADRWLRSYVAVHLKPSTQEMYETVLKKHWTPVLGPVPLTAITRERIKTQLGTLLRAGLSANRVKGALNVLTPGAFWQNVWGPLLKRAEVRYRKPHALRHTFASLLIQQGESLAYVRDQMGHHSIKVTVDIYGHLMPRANKAAVDRLDDATSRNPYATETVTR